MTTVDQRRMVQLRGALYGPLMEVMNFLNDVQVDYPNAISFAPGRPMERFFNVSEAMASVERYVRYRAETTGLTTAEVVDDLGQYQRSRGMINELIARQLANDERIVVSPESVLITDGAQEAMLILLLGLFDPARDVLLHSDPTYVGITGPATMLGIEMVAVPSGPDGVDPDAIAEAVRETRRRGKVPRAFYDIPDFNNPLGTSMPIDRRRALLRLAEAEGFLVLEDNPYGMFDYEGEPQSPLKALDSSQVVVYIGSFAKTVFPGLRIGMLVADQRCAPGGRLLAAELSKVKSLTTVTTSPFPQSVLGGILLEHDCTLRQYVRPKLEFYGANRDLMVERLALEFGKRGMDATVTWNRPRGGFFMTLTLPFTFDADCLRTCAHEYGVVVCPMSFFSLRPGREDQIRLSFSYVDREQIETGVARLAEFVSRRALGG